MEGSPSHLRGGGEREVQEMEVDEGYDSDGDWDEHAHEINLWSGKNVHKHLGAGTPPPYATLNPKPKP